MHSIHATKNVLMHKLLELFIFDPNLLLKIVILPSEEEKRHGRKKGIIVREESSSTSKPLVQKNNPEHVKKGLHYWALKTWNNIPINFF